MSLLATFLGLAVHGQHLDYNLYAIYYDSKLIQTTQLDPTF